MRARGLLGAALGVTLLAAGDAGAYVRSRSNACNPIYWPQQCVYVTLDKSGALGNGNQDLSFDDVVTGTKNAIDSWQSRLAAAGSYLQLKYYPADQNRETELGNFNQALRFTVYFEGQEKTIKGEAHSLGTVLKACQCGFRKISRPAASVRKISSCTLRISTLSSRSLWAMRCCALLAATWAASRNLTTRHTAAVKPATSRTKAPPMPKSALAPDNQRHTTRLYDSSTITTSGLVLEARNARSCRSPSAPRPTYCSCSLEGR